MIKEVLKIGQRHLFAHIMTERGRAESAKHSHTCLTQHVSGVEHVVEKDGTVVRSVCVSTFFHKAVRCALPKEEGSIGNEAQKIVTPVSLPKVCLETTNHFD